MCGLASLVCVLMAVLHMFRLQDMKHTMGCVVAFLLCLLPVLVTVCLVSSGVSIFAEYN